MKFSSFCTQCKVDTPFPVTEPLLCCFAVFLADQGPVPQTGKGYLAAVRNMQLSLGLPDPREQSLLPILKRVQTGIRWVRAASGTTSRPRLPITASVLEGIGAHLRTTNYPHKELLWAVACTTFFGFFQLGELLPEPQGSISSTQATLWRDVAIDSRENPSMVRMHLRWSKCDQFHRGADIILGKTRRSVCAVSTAGDSSESFWCRVQIIDVPCAIF